MENPSEMGVSIDAGSVDFDLEDLYVESKEEWDKLTDEEQEKLIQRALDEMPEQVNKFIEEFKIIIDG